jgi:ferredoxin
MPHIVLESCIRCRYTDCVDVCPVDCFREGPNMLVIDPDECIDCAVCIPECPVEAIKAEEDVPADQQKFVALNAELAKTWPSITRTKPALTDADDEPASPRMIAAAQKRLAGMTTKIGRAVDLASTGRREAQDSMETCSWQLTLCSWGTDP